MTCINKQMRFTMIPMWSLIDKLDDELHSNIRYIATYVNNVVCYLPHIRTQIACLLFDMKI